MKLKLTLTVAVAALGTLWARGVLPSERAYHVIADTLSGDAQVARWASGFAHFDKNGQVEAPRRFAVDEMYMQTEPCQDQWWKSWDDPVLSDLLRRAEENNLDARTALLRIQMAKESLAETRAGYFPTLGVSAGYTFERGSGANGKPAVKGADLNYLTLGVNASWEVDLFGRLYDRVKGAKAQVALTRAERNAVLVSLCANIAKNYVLLRGYQAQYALDKSHCASQAKLVDMTLARQEAGLASGLDVAQARQVYYSTLSQLPVLEAQIESSMNALSILAGEYPGTLVHTLSVPRVLPDVLPVNPAVGTPVEMIRRRPDIAQAAAQIEVYASQLGVAKKDYLPSLSVNAALGVSAHNMGDLFTDKGLNYSVGPSLSWTLWEGGARRARVASAREQMEIATEQYNQTLLNALEEVVTNCNSYKGYNEQLRVLDTLIGESRLAVSLSVDLYRSSLTAFTNVVNAQMDLLQYENQQITAKCNAINALIGIYEALGGGY